MIFIADPIPVLGHISDMVQCPTWSAVRGTVDIDTRQPSLGQ